MFGTGAGAEYGSSLSDAGDVNNDGFHDVIVGAPLADNNGSNSGIARVFSGVDGSILYTFNGDSSGDQLGYSVSGAGDVTFRSDGTVSTGAATMRIEIELNGETTGRYDIGITNAGQVKATYTKVSS